MENVLRRFERKRKTFHLSPEFLSQLISHLLTDHELHTRNRMFHDQVELFVHSHHIHNHTKIEYKYENVQ